MNDKGMQRKLRAIFSADVKGYSKLMGDDDESTVSTITTYREIIAGLIEKHQGRVVDAPGDNLLAEFSSALNAVNSAIEIQGKLETENAKLPENRRMEFRIGINLGDILHREDRIYGDGVNVAARIESLADSGGICVSRGVFDQVKNKVRQGFEYLGEHLVKNISDPVRIYRVLLSPEYDGRIIGEPASKTTIKKASVVVIGLIILVCAALLWMTYHRPETMEPASVDKIQLQMPAEPSIAVLPFENLGGDAEQGVIVDGITEEIITGLSKVPNLFIISRKSTSNYKGKSVDIGQVGKELGVRYVLQGSVRTAEDRVRITAQLVDTITKGHVWSERYERELEDIFSLQDDITKRILEALQIELTVGEEARVYARGTNDLNAYLKLLKARNLTLSMNTESNRLARQIIQEIISMDPEYASAYFVLSISYFLDVLLVATDSPEESLKLSIESSKKAVAMDDTSSSAMGFLGYLYTYIGEYDEGVDLCKRAIELGPTDEAAHRYLASAFRFSGRWDEAVVASERAIRLNPFPDSGTLSQLAMAYGFTGQYDKAIETCKRATEKNPNHLTSHILCTAIYAMADRMEDAKTTAAEVIRINPDFSAEKYLKGIKYRRKEDINYYLQALKKAGLK